MSVYRTVTCNWPGCDYTYRESAPNVGWPGWGQLNGIILNDNENPHLCPEHLARVANFIDKADT